VSDQPFEHELSEEPREPTEDELRAAYEAELAQLRIEEVLIQTIVSLLNLGARKAGLVPGSEAERDLDQVRLAIEGARALLPVAEPMLGPNAGPLRDALSQLQMAYAQLAGGPGSGEGGPAGPGEQGEPGGQGGEGAGPAQSSGRLWVPGQ
jgi:hypothetical protein